MRRQPPVTAARWCAAVLALAVAARPLAAAGVELVSDLPPAPLIRAEDAALVQDPGFEVPALDAYAYGPVGGHWRYTDSAGLSVADTGFTNGNPPPPEGRQVALIQGTAVLAQTVAGFHAGGVYRVSVHAAQRGNRNDARQDLEIVVGDTVVGTLVPGDTQFRVYQSRPFRAGAERLEIVLRGRNSAGGDNTVFLDQLRIERLPVAAPYLEAGDADAWIAPVGGDGLEPGLAYLYEHVTAEMAPSHAVASGVVATPTLAPALRQEHWRIAFDGFFRAPADGVYEIGMAVDDAATIAIGGRMALPAPAQVNAPANGRIGLRAGWHPIEIRAYQGLGASHLAVTIAGPGLERQALPPELLAHRPGQIAAAPLSPAPLDANGRGGLLWEAYLGLPGDNRLESLLLHERFPAQPQLRMVVRGFALPPHISDGYGSRYRGWLHPAESGSYRFHLVSDDESALYLSDGPDPRRMRKIAWVAGWVGWDDFDVKDGQRSMPQRLEAGQRYFIEVRHREGVGGDFVRLQWSRDDGARQEIDPALLSPWRDDVDGG